MNKEAAQFVIDVLDNEIQKFSSKDAEKIQYLQCAIDIIEKNIQK